MSFVPPPPDPHNETILAVPRPCGLKRGERRGRSPKSSLRGDMLYVPSHEFKTHMAQYLRLLEQDTRINFIVITQYKDEVAIIVPTLHRKRKNADVEKI